MAALVLVVGVGAVSYWYYRGHRAEHAGAAGHEKGAESDSVGAPVSVKTVNPRPGGIVRTSTQIGTVHPKEVAELFAKVSGYLAELHVDYGDQVKKGQILAEIDDPEVLKEAQRDRAALEQAKAAVTQAEARLETAKADAAAAAAAVEETEAEIERTASRTRYRQKVLDRYRRLVAQNAEAPELVDEYEEHLESAKADEHSAKAAHTTAVAKAAAAKALVSQATADVTESKATVEVVRANMEKSEVLVDYTKIRSPYDGVVTDRKFFRGAFIRSAADGNTVPLLTVARTDVVRVVTMVPDRDVPYVDVGDAAEVTLDALGGEVLKGKVSRFANVEDPESRTMHTEIDLPNPDGRIRPGMYGIARLILDDSTKAVTLPATCLAGESKEGQGEVYVVRDGKAAKLSVEIGADNGVRFEVLSGVEPKDTVILRPTGVSDGMRVKPTQATAVAGKSKSAAS